MIGYIYKITCKDNNMIYIGLTTLKNPNDRWKQHKKTCLNKDKLYRPLYGDMIKYSAIEKDFNNYTFEIIDSIEDEFVRNKLGKLERYYIKRYNTIYPNGYNLTTGGEGGHEYAIITREKISKSLTGKKTNKKWVTNGYNNKQILINELTIFLEHNNDWYIGKSVSQETRDKQSISAKKRKTPSNFSRPEVRDKILTRASESSIKSWETRRKKGNDKLSDEHKLKIGLSNKNQVRTEETKENIRQSLLNYHKNKK